MADPTFNQSGPIDLILSAEVFWDVLESGRVKISEPNLYLSETLFGWIVGGAFDASYNKVRATACNYASCKRIDNSNLDNILQQFWLQEKVETEVKNKSSPEDQECEDHFLKTFKRDKADGRFIIQLPFKNNIVDLGDSSKNALKRFLSLERKFIQDPEFQEAYTQSFRENLNSNIIEKVPVDESNVQSTFYLPHWAVIKKPKPSKVRIVFDGSAKSTNGRSLNDNLMTGPNLQNDLFNVLTRFRKHEIVLSCDMEKMFLQIKVD